VRAGGGGPSETTIERFVMPDGSDFVLQQDAVYTLPVKTAGPIDIAAATSLLFMVVSVGISNQVRVGTSADRDMRAGSHCTLHVGRPRHRVTAKWADMACTPRQHSPC